MMTSWDFLADLLDLTERPQASAPLVPLHGLTGGAYWDAYHTLAPDAQHLAQTSLWLDDYFCGWSPGADTWLPIVVVPPPGVPNVPAPPAIPEMSVWMMMLMGLIAIVAQPKRNAQRR